MAFKATKMMIDLTLDLTAYIPEEKGGILTTNKTDAMSINAWSDMAIIEGDKIQEKEKAYENEEIKMSEVVAASKKSLIKQIDFFYEKGEDFYKQLPAFVMNEIVKYINNQISPVKKKSKR